MERPTPRSRQQPDDLHATREVPDIAWDKIATDDGDSLSVIEVAQFEAGGGFAAWRT